MSLQTQINAVNCGQNGVIGTGLAGCRIDRKRVTALGLLEKGTKFTQEIDKDYMRELQVAGKLIMLQDVVSFTDNTADDNIITRAGSGIKVVAGKNPYEYAVEFDNGIAFHKALTSLSGYGNYDLILFDVDNSIFLTKTKSGDAKGFTMGMFENGKYTGSNGTDASGYVVSLQLIKRSEIDVDQAVITNDSLDFDYSELKGVNEIELIADPITAGTTIVLSAKLQDMTHNVEGLLVGNFKVVRNGVVVVPSAVSYNATSGKYTLTTSANVSTDVIEVSLNGIVLTENEDLYKSQTITAVVA